VLAAVFFATSIGLALLARLESRPSDILETLPGQTAPAETDTPAPPVPQQAPASAADVLEQLGGPGPQTPPTESEEGAAAPAEPAAPQPAPAQ
jgi:preprotein translocase subunit SecG